MGFLFGFLEAKGMIQVRSGLQVAERPQKNGLEFTVAAKLQNIFQEGTP